MAFNLEESKEAPSSPVKSSTRSPEKKAVPEDLKGVVTEEEYARINAEIDGSDQDGKDSDSDYSSGEEMEYE